MLRKYNNKDINQVLKIWLSTSITAHHFIEVEFWKSQLENMRNIYIPASETYVFERENMIVGFYSLYGNHLAAIFVSTKEQGQGIGTILITHAKQQRKQLSLSVYKENEASYQFYLKQDFTITSEQVDKYTGHTEFTMKLSSSHK
ncbi:N-acetyltransferase [Aliivibrio sifiae]|uniref:N-acetyltransferase n=1 Tax=Aliivibrio sifiae TaxID=566293 RepID=UPI003D0B816E